MDVKTTTLPTHDDWLQACTPLASDRKDFLKKFANTTYELTNLCSQLLKEVENQEKGWDIEATAQHTASDGVANSYLIRLFSEHQNTKYPEMNWYHSRAVDDQSNFFRLQVLASFDANFRPLKPLEYSLQVLTKLHTDTPEILHIPVQEMLAEIGMVSSALEDNLEKIAVLELRKAVARHNSTYAEQFLPFKPFTPGQKYGPIALNPKYEALRTICKTRF